MRDELKKVLDLVNREAGKEVVEPGEGVMDACGGNYDDAHELGSEYGRAELATELKPLLGALAEALGEAEAS